MRGEVSIFRGGAGGMLYFSSGSLNGAFWIGASVCADALVSASSEVRPVKEARFKSVEDLIVWLRVKRLKW